MGYWYDTAWKERAPVSVDILGGAGSPALYDIQFTVPADWQRFWDNIKPDGFDVILTNADGDLLTFKRVSFTYASQALVLAVDNFSSQNNDSTNLIWIYWNNSAATDLTSAFSPTSTKEAIIYLGQPSNRVVGHSGINAQTTDSPSVIFGKTTVDDVNIWFNTGAYLSKRIDPQNKRLFFEAIRFCQVELYGKTGVPVTLTCDESKTRFISGWTACRVAAGTDGQNYTIALNITTTLGQIFSLRCGLQVRDKLPE
tara:strand:+ start:865 stop:1629 length:765 start_codon:yes stop_codon:yes gene_type:complete